MPQLSSRTLKTAEKYCASAASIASFALMTYGASSQSTVQFRHEWYEMQTPREDSSRRQNLANVLRGDIVSSADLAMSDFVVTARDAAEVRRLVATRGARPRFVTADARIIIE